MRRNLSRLSGTNVRPDWSAADSDEFSHNLLKRMGLSLREEGRYEEALKCFRALAKTERKHEAQILIAETLYLGERDDMALAAYREALKTPVVDKKKLFEIYKNIGNIHVRASDYESAEEFYNKAYVLRSDSDVLMVNYGTLEIQRENFAEAVLRFRKSVEINPNNDKGWVGLSLVHRQMGDHELAGANVQRALDINHTNRTAIRLVVDWGAADQDFTVAIARLQNYLAAEGEDAEMSFTLARIFIHVARLPEARIELERVLALDPAMQGAEALMNALDREATNRPSTPPRAENKAGVV
jgi:tetratricopeptide (TPR) repeat protein